VAFQGEAGAFSEAAAVQLLGEAIETVPCPTFEATFRAISAGMADALLVPVENSLAGSVVRVYDLLLESELGIIAETILPIELNLIACPGASLAEIHSVASHPMALAQCERFFSDHSNLKRVPAEDTAGSVREVLNRGNKTHAAIAGRRAATHYGGVILKERIQDNAENFTRFVLLVQTQPAGGQDVPNSARAAFPGAADLSLQLLMRQMEGPARKSLLKMSIAMRLAHRPGSLLSSLEPFARYGVNLLKIESRPIHGRPWEYQFFVDLEAEDAAHLQQALTELREAAHEVRVLGMYQPAKANAAGSVAGQNT
jgi:prephenate dehydratase